ncbi:MAG: hypothetical protein R2706_12085 [Acidimicrobiales bacterium]
MMALSFLSFAATNQFQIAFYGIGPTEIRIGYIALNTLVYFAGSEMFWWGSQSSWPATPSHWLSSPIRPTRSCGRSIRVR